MSWLQDLLRATKEQECPQSYFYWAALTTLSATVGKRIYLSRGGAYNLYPNIYTFIISKKSGLRKGMSVNLARKLANNVGTIRIIDGQNSIQGVMKALSKLHTTPAKHVVNKAEGFLITGEFASFLLSDGLSFSLTTLTDLYDTQYHDHGFKKRLASQDELELKEPCLTSLFASNETHFFDSIPRNAITGGFLARTFCVYEEKANTINSLMREQKGKIDYKTITKFLVGLTKLKGEMKIEEKAKVLYEEWYNGFRNRDSDDDTGTEERIGDSLLKLAMLLSLIDSTDLIITHKQMDEAITKSMECFSNLRRLLVGSGDAKSIKSTVARTIMALLTSSAPKYETHRRAILIKGIGLFGPYDLNETTEHFLQSKLITIEKRGSEEYYKLTNWAIESFLKLKIKVAEGK